MLWRAGGPRGRRPPESLHAQCLQLAATNPPRAVRVHRALAGPERESRMEALNLPDPFYDLVEDYLNGLLDEPRLRALDEHLRTDPAARDQFVRYARLHTDLHREMRASQASERILAAIDTEFKPTTAQRTRLFHRAYVLKTAAAVLFVTLGSWFLVAHFARQGTDRGATVAWLVNAQNCRWADDVGPAGDMKTGKVLHLERGLAEVRFQCGAS